jgi:predicted dinucleotide-binding enzyme
MVRPGRPPHSEAMRIGIVGTGNMGQALGLQWAERGHEVLFGSRDPDKARAVAARAAGSVRAGDFDAAAAFGEVVLYTVRDVLPSRLLRRPEALATTIVIDCNNRDIGDGDDPAAWSGGSAPGDSPTERLARDLPGARVVKAFNTVPHKVIELPRALLAEQRISVFLCADDAAAKAVVKRLAEDVGFVAVDSGALARAALVDAVADFVRFQIIAMGLGRFATMSLKVVPAPAAPAPEGGAR